ncbi:MAG: hypothetical protein M1401_08535 [Chloroflexi bacterium]|nr:hypothetical protein [Chloroflexota bacterium]MCL5108893.1 hypothetical protein [Chloroflexota bacterium]
MRLLHIVRDFEDVRALTMAAAQAAEHEVSLLLLHEAAEHVPAFPGKVYTCLADVVRLGILTNADALDYSQIVDLLGEHDRVICW